MNSRSVEKIIEGLSLFMDGFIRLQESVEDEIANDTPEEDRDEETNAEIDAAVIIEVRAALEGVMDAEDYSTEEIATCLSCLTEVLEELDPDVFEREGEQEEAFVDEDDEDDIDYDDDDIDFDDEDDEDYDDDEDDEDYEDEDYEEEDGDDDD